MKTIKIIKPLFFLAITLLIFWLIFQKIDYRSLKEVLLNANLFYLAMALLVILLVPVFSAKKWQSMLKAMNYSISFKESLKIIMASFPISAITPSKSGDLIRAYYLKDSIPPTRTAGAIMAERLIDVSILAFYSFIGAVILKNWLILGISLSIIFLIPIFFFVVNKINPAPFVRILKRCGIKLSSSKWQEKIESFLYVSKIFIKLPKKSLPVLFYSLFLWSILIFEVKLLFLALGTDIPLFYIAAAFPIAIFIGLIPITIAGMGTRDSAVIYLFSSFATATVCLGVGLLYSLFASWFLALLGLPVMKKILK